MKSKNYITRLFQSVYQKPAQLLVFLAFGCFASNVALAQISFETASFEYSMNNKGLITGLKNRQTGLDYLNKDTVSYLLCLISDNLKITPSSSKLDKQNGVIKFIFDKLSVEAEVRIIEKTTHLTFEVVRAEPSSLIDGISWGPVFTSVSKKTGEVVGVVRDDDISLGMLLLNVKTIGGFYNKNGLCEERGSLAWPWKSGSSLQAYSLNRSKQRNVDAMGHLNIPLKPMIGETVVGSKIALFSCDEPATLGFIEKIVIDEHLPYPTVNGVWTKKAFLTSPSYLISDFKESEIDGVIAYAKRGGFFSVYHEGPFGTWGHFELDTAYFPGGKDGIKQCAQKAREAGLFFGVHTLTNFITPNDAYITPVPDNRLAYTGYGFLTSDTGSENTEIEVSTCEYFSESVNNNMHTVMIGSELIRYQSVTETKPYVLKNCERGAFGTNPANHLKNDTVKKLIDHAYKVFFPNIELQREISIGLAKFFNETGISHLDFDGFEGCLASGEGDYAMSLWAEDFYNTIGHDWVNGTSRSKPYYWYINTLCNWGEPWYGGFRESMQEYRISNQAMLERNYFPNMLGWYMLTKNTTLPEMEWMLARAAGWNAGFAMVIRMKAIEANPSGMVLLDAIREWEKARLTGAFTDEQRERLKNSKNDFHLEKINENEWNLFQFEKSPVFVHEFTEKQPGQPTASAYEFSIDSFEQKIRFLIEVKGVSGSARNFVIQTDNFHEIKIAEELKTGETMICDGSDMIRIYDEKGKLKSSVHLSGKIPLLAPGKHQITFDADFSGEESPKVEMIVKWMKNPEIIKKGR